MLVVCVAEPRGIDGRVEGPDEDEGDEDEGGGAERCENGNDNGVLFDLEKSASASTSSKVLVICVRWMRRGCS